MLELNNLLSEGTQKKINELKSQLDFAVERKRIIDETFNKINIKTISDCFDKLKVDVKSYTMLFSNDTELPIEELAKKSLQVQFRVSPRVGSKIKPISFAGYDSRGRGKNQERLYNKAFKLEQEIQAATGYKVSINHYGLEVKAGKDFSFSVQLEIQNI